MAEGRPKVVFVLGGPGAGKGTQCAKVIENFDKWAHISAGDCLRAERNNPESKDGELINSIISEGKIVPVAITIKLLMKAMAASQAEGKTCFLIDGYPRNMDNVSGWEENVGDKAEVCGVLFYEANEAELEKRLLARGATSGRSDDANVEVIKKRFRTYMEESLPIVKRFRETGKVWTIDGMPAVEEVWKFTQAAIRVAEGQLPKVVFVLGPPGAGKGTQCAKIVENSSQWAHISAGDCLRAERNNPESKDGELINSIISEGKIVPVAITIKLLMKAMAQSQADGKRCFLIDGYPRNMDNVTGWTEHVGSDAKVCGVLFYEANEAELEKRLLARHATSGRSDDANAEVIQKRFRTYMEESLPIVNLYKESGKVWTIDGMPPVEDVWKLTEKAVKEVEAM